MPAFAPYGSEMQPGKAVTARQWAGRRLWWPLSRGLMQGLGGPLGACSLEVLLLFKWRLAWAPRVPVGAAIRVLQESKPGTGPPTGRESSGAALQTWAMAQRRTPSLGPSGPCVPHLAYAEGHPVCTAEDSPAPPHLRARKWGRWKAATRSSAFISRNASGKGLRLGNRWGECLPPFAAEGAGGLESVPASELLQAPGNSTGGGL